MMIKEKKASKKRKSRDASQDASVAQVSGVEPAPEHPSKRLLLSPIATPLADDKLKKRVLKLAKKASESKHLKRGVKEVVKAIKKNTKGLCIVAGDIAPLDVISHIPIMCEDRNIPYIYVPSKEELGAAAASKRPCSCMLVVREEAKSTVTGEDLKAIKDLYDDVYKRVKAVQIVF